MLTQRPAGLFLDWMELARPASWGWQFRRWLLAERLRWWLWLPVAIGCGIAVYFNLSFEPRQLSMSVAALLPLGFLVFQFRRDAPVLLFLSVMAMGVVLGFTAAQWRASQAAAPILPYQGSFEVTGTVVLAEPKRGKQRVVLGDLSIDGLKTEKTPRYVRVTLRKDERLTSAGDRIAVKARLQPPGGPLLPGGFDFARQAWFEGLGGLGYAIGSWRLLDAAVGYSFFNRVNGLRQQIADAATDAIDGPSAAVAAALLTALRAGIADEVWRDMQLSGLAHLLAISGLHMGLVAGTVFLAVRYGIALLPRLVLAWPAKKYAAVAALAVSSFYLLMAGMTVPTTRAFIMTGVALLAILADRNPLSMRLVALAASLILLTRPESLLGASFQMSFAAVIGLIAFYEGGPRWLSSRGAGDDSASSREGWRLIWLYFAGVAVTTLIATIATSPLAAYHFQRVATYGIAANLIAVPLTAFWIMPAGLLALAAMPFSLEQPFFWIMGEGIDLLLAIAHGMASLPGAGLNAGQMPLAALLLFAAGGLWLCLWRERWRWLGVLFWLAVIPVVLSHRLPDLVIERGGGLVALRNEQGLYDLIRWRNDSYVISNWQRSLGGAAFGTMPEPGSGRVGAYACAEDGCTAFLHGRMISVARTPAAAVEDCGYADLLIATRAVDRCGRSGSFVGSRELWLSGGMSLYLSDNDLERRTVTKERGQRPWTGSQ